MRVEIHDEGFKPPDAAPNPSDKQEAVKLCTICNGYGRYQDGNSGTEADGYAPNIVECECADEERMPEYRAAAPRASYGSGMIDAIEDFAPVPRADADTAGASDAYRKALAAVAHSRTIYEAETYLQKLLDESLAAGASNERADAEQRRDSDGALSKDAERYRWLRDNGEKVQKWGCAVWFPYDGLVAKRLDNAIDAAILAANGEKK